jgi:hypothetical protein
MESISCGNCGGQVANGNVSSGPANFSHHSIEHSQYRSRSTSPYRWIKVYISWDFRSSRWQQWTWLSCAMLCRVVC